jgi:hypothetical protein
VFHTHTLEGGKKGRTFKELKKRHCLSYFFSVYSEPSYFNDNSFYANFIFNTKKNYLSKYY